MTRFLWGYIFEYFLAGNSNFRQCCRRRVVAQVTAQTNEADFATFG